MSTSVLPRLSHRDRAVLRAIAADRCTVTDDTCHSLTIDGVCFCDQFVGVRLADVGLVEASGPAPLRPHLTDAGRSLLTAA
ncbi:hypothetical protein [Pseudonocardia parietis]|uniref:Winged helix DNA-binding protein n=1 Tax=Pseudonocardia parietis TaxID=570936 RepID=A0ABS4VYC1_9PSEU|nr:hypothetical protein [Pseudonocardia parietis]MBP2368723.1 hypothetical protein [Pseudonocardia parietis]